MYKRYSPLVHTRLETHTAQSTQHTVHFGSLASIFGCLATVFVNLANDRHLLQFASVH